MSEEMKLILDRLEKMDAKLDRLDTAVEKQGKRLDAVEEKFTRLDIAVEKQGKCLDTMEKKLSDMNTVLEYHTDCIQRLDTKLSEIQLTIENDINTKIMIIAEGHIDLNRKLDEALRIEHEKEMFLLRITSLENDVKRIKNRIGEFS